MGNISIESKVGGRIHVGSDVYAPTRVELTLTGMEEIGADVAAVLLLEGQRYVVQELRITRQDDGAPITSELIRGIRVQSLIPVAVRESVELRIAEPSPKGTDRHRVTGVVLTPKERRRIVSAGPTDETLLWVARIYVMAELAGEPPAKSVKENLDIPMPTAGNWIRRAKDRGILKQQATTVEPRPAQPSLTVEQFRALKASITEER